MGAVTGAGAFTTAVGAEEWIGYVGELATAAFTTDDNTEEWIGYVGELGVAAFTTGDGTELFLGNIYAPVGTSPKGAVPTANSHHGIVQVALSLVHGVAKTWTHNFNARPLVVQLYASNGHPMEQGLVAVTTAANSITLTPACDCNIWVLIMWDLPSQWVNGIPTTNFA